MRAGTAAAYCDERSVQSFLRSVGGIYPEPLKVSGKGDRWLREDLDAAIERLAGKQPALFDAASVLGGS